MKLCFPSAELRGLESAMEPHFPHATAYLIFDTEDRTCLQIPLGDDAPLEQDHGPIDVVICGSINRRGLHHLQQHGVQVMGSHAETIAEAIAQFERGELRAVPSAQHHEHGHGCCGGHEQGQGHHHAHDHHGHGCCSGWHDNATHESGCGGGDGCCGGGGGECGCKG